MNPSTLLIVLLSSVGLAILLVALFTMRRRSLARLSGAFDCSTRVGDGSRRPRWRLGVGVFTVTALEWYPVFSLGRRPVFELPRSDLEITDRQQPDANEQHAVLPDAQIITCRYGVHGGDPHDVLLALDTEALSAFSSWLESAPPGSNLTMGRFT
ncbi:DUF2550 domain-containing protein [Brevibacterium ihuae]|uniref:DUF2550 domain-containing protein n=1 Tax=Brevibacterium ihuae TaxID=1631743 RepID=UPI000C76CB29|nr:DUF2550 domain-containing protein [Brevibacterium ihuae]